MILHERDGCLVELLSDVSFFSKLVGIDWFEFYIRHAIRIKFVTEYQVVFLSHFEFRN